MPYRGAFGAVVTLHVLAAVFVIGPLGAATLAAPRFVRAGVDGLAGLRVTIRWIRYLSLGSIVPAAIGFSMIHQGPFGSVRKISDTWLLWSIILWVVAVGANLTIVVPALKRAAAGDGDGRRYLPVVTVSAGITALCWVLIVILMMVKPGT